MTSKTQFTTGYFAIITIFAFGLISNIKAETECPEGTYKYIRGWALPNPGVGDTTHVNLFNYGDKSIHVLDVQTSAIKSYSGTWLVSGNALSALISVGAASSSGIRYSSTNVVYSVRGQIGIHIGEDILGGQLINFSSPANISMYQPMLKGFTLIPGHGLLFRGNIPADAFLRFAFSWCE